MIELLVFSAENCGPCKAMERAGIYTEVSASGYKVTKIDVYSQNDKASLYRINAMPTFVVLKDGIEITRAVGARDKAGLLQLINSAN
jgi:thioredoxin 1